MTKQLPKAYTPQDVESSLYQRWEKSGFFNPDNLPGARKKAFSIAMPPPNVTGELHLGHATALTLEDILTRYHRMRGDKTLFLPGTDHAGISTQVMVERLIAKEGLSKHKIGRDVFLRRVWDWKKQYGSRITQQIRQLGTSCDWSREHFTMDETLTRAVQEAFITLYNEGLIYRGNRIVNWCTRCNSALSDLEVKHAETSSKLWYVRYPLFGSTKYIVVATTRPETMLGDTAVAVHPDDKRYQRYIGKRVVLPLMNRDIPIIPDKRVDSSFGTGAVKVTPAHDHLDYEMGQDHRLDVINVIGPDGRMTKSAGEWYGKNTQDARRAIIQALEQEELLDKTIDYVHNQACCDRCNAPIEPLISKQWFVDIKPLAKPAIAAVKNKKITIVPSRFEKIYFHWMTNIKDWCISRQLWWGHQIPIWYCGMHTDLPDRRMGFAARVVPQLARGKTKTYRLRDHHFSKGDRVTFENSKTGAVLGVGTITRVEKTTVAHIDLKDPEHGATYQRHTDLIAAFKRHYPRKKITKSTHVFIYSYTFKSLPDNQGCDNIVASADKPKRCPQCKESKHLIQDPDTLDTWFSSGLWTFSTLGWPQKTKDLKTFHPTSVMETGWDILFFWVARMIMLSLHFTKQIPFKTVYLNGLVLDRDGKKMSKSKGTGIDPLLMTEKYGTDAIRLSLVLGTTAGQDLRLYEDKIAGYRNYVNKLWNISRFILSTFPDKPKRSPSLSLADQWILHRTQQLTREVTQHLNNLQFSEAGTALYDFTWHAFADWYIEISKTERNGFVLHTVLDTILRLSHPFIPYVTEEIWSVLKGTADTNLLMIQPWPRPQARHRRPAAEKDFGLLQDLVVQIRNFRAENKVPAAEKLSVAYWGKRSKLITDNASSIMRLARLEALTPERHTETTGTLTGLSFRIDASHNAGRKQKELASLSKHIQSLESKLSNKQFTEKAPRAVVEGVRAKLEEQRERLKKLM